MADQLRVYFHFRSPYSRVGLHMLHEARVDDLIPTDLKILTKAAGTDDIPNPVSTSAKRLYIMQDVPRVTLKAGLPIAMPNPMDPDYRPASTAFYQARTKGKGLAFAAALSNLRWGEGKNISEESVLQEAADAAQVDMSGTAPSLKEQLTEDTAWLEKDGAFGVPFAALEKDGKTERFFGQDRFDLLLERIKA